MSEERRTPTPPPTPETITGTVPVPAPEARDPRIHSTYSETVARHYERARQTGLPPDSARKVANEAARRNHEGWNRRG